MPVNFIRLVSLKEADEIGWAWIVLGQEVHNIIGEVGHVLSDDVCDVAARDFLVVHHHRTDLGHSPLSIDGRRHGVLLSHNQGDWDLSDVFKWNEVVKPVFVTNGKRVIEVWAPLLEPIHSHVLGKHHYRLHRSTVGLVVNIDPESVWIVSQRVVTDKHVLNSLANRHIKRAVRAPEGSHSIVTWENLVNVIEFGPVVQRVVVLSEFIHVPRISGDLGHGAKGYKEVNFTGIVVLELG